MSSGKTEEAKMRQSYDMQYKLRAPTQEELKTLEAESPSKRAERGLKELREGINYVSRFESILREDPTRRDMWVPLLLAEDSAVRAQIRGMDPWNLVLKIGQYRDYIRR